MATTTVPPGENDDSQESQNNSGERNGLTVGADVMTKATANLPEDQRLAIRWLYTHIKLDGISLKQAAKEMGRDGGTLWRVFSGTYEAKLDRVVHSINTYRTLVESRSLITKIDFIETSVSKKIWEVCRWALHSNSVAFIFGDSQIGKTSALEEYQRRNNHGQTKMFRMPATPGVHIMMKEIAVCCLEKGIHNFETRRQKILGCLDKNTLLIADEVHQPMLSYHRKTKIGVFEVLRELHDRSKCGLVLCGTNVFRKELVEGEHKEILEQLSRRGVVKLQLPKKLPRADLDTFAAAFGLKPATDAAEDLMLRIIQESGLGKFKKFLEAGSRLANKKNVKLTWEHFVRAHDILARLSEEEGEK